ncbi:MAG: hypothetical protein ACI4I5_07095 [Acutalibacteraceae bacterium]
MINLILGHKGSGKTKKLISLVNEAMEKSDGCVVCIEKEPLLTYNVNYRVRLIDTDNYGIEGCDQMLGFLCGVCAGNHDITDILVDATLKICGRDFTQIGAFLAAVDKYCAQSGKNVTFTISADKEELPAEVFDFCQII